MLVVMEKFRLDFLFMWIMLVLLGKFRVVLLSM